MAASKIYIQFKFLFHDTLVFLKAFSFVLLIFTFLFGKLLDIYRPILLSIGLNLYAVSWHKRIAGNIWPNNFVFCWSGNCICSVIVKQVQEEKVKSLPVLLCTSWKCSSLFWEQVVLSLWRRSFSDKMTTTSCRWCASTSMLLQPSVIRTWGWSVDY